MSRGLTILSLLLLVPASRAADSANLSEVPRPGTLYKISARGELRGTLIPPPAKDKPPEPIKMEGSSIADYDERIESIGTDGLVSKTIRLCQRLEVQRTVGGQAQQNVLRQAVRRLVMMREKQAKAPFSPDGPLAWTEIDLIRAEVFFPMLVGLLPGKEATVGDRWPVANYAIQELTGLEKLNQGGLECVLTGVQMSAGRRVARVDFKGDVRGTTEDGASQQKIDGHYLFDIDAAALTFVSLTGTHLLISPDGKESGRIEGRFVMHRQMQPTIAGLADADLRGLDLIPGGDNTAILYDSTETGVKFVYPRRWHLAKVQGRQITLDTPTGDGLLLTIEAEAAMPTATAYQKETREWIEKQRGKIKRSSEPRAVQPSPAIEHFGLEVDLANQLAVMDYYLCRQKGGGALLAARIGPVEQREIRLEVEKIAKSVTITRTIER